MSAAIHITCPVCHHDIGTHMPGDPRPVPETICARCGASAVSGADLEEEIAAYEALVARIGRLPREQRAGAGEAAVIEVQEALAAWAAAAGVGRWWAPTPGLRLEAGAGVAAAARRAA